MGNNAQGQEKEYGYFVGEEKLGETRALRSSFVKPGHPLHTTPIEGITTMVQAFENAREKTRNEGFLGTRRQAADGSYDPYTWRSYNECHEIIQATAKGYLEFNFCPEIHSEEEGSNKFIGIYSKNREEWLMCELAAWFISATVIPFYDTLGEDSLEYIIEETSLTTIIIQNSCLQKVLNIKSKRKGQSLQNLILLDPISDEDKREAKALEINVFPLQVIIEAGRKSDHDLIPAQPETLSMLCYTSGTTGIPKGVKITQCGLLADVAGYYNLQWLHLVKQDIYFSYLPLAHVFEQLIINCAICFGIRIGFYHGEIFKLTEDLALLKPTYMASVPRLFHKFYDLITAKMSSTKGFKKKLITRAIKVKLENLEQTCSVHHYFYDKLVFNKIKKVLGGRLKLMISGAAPISKDILSFLKLCFCCPIVEGYGSTESIGGVSITYPDDALTGHVGGVFSSCEIKLKDINEMNYRSTDHPFPRGEVCYRGYSVMNGYFKHRDTTLQFIDSDGWVHSGDVGMFISGNRLEIFDRIKNIFKLQQGEYVAAEKLENIYIKSPFVSQIFVYGDSLKNFIVAVVLPEKDVVYNWAQMKEFPASYPKLCSCEELKKDIQQDLLRLWKDAKVDKFIFYSFKLTGIERLKHIELTPTEFTIENGTLTPTFKIKRKPAEELHKDLIRKMYEESE